MKIYLATDHAGFELKEKVKKFLGEQARLPSPGGEATGGQGYEVEDFGAYQFDKEDDYPDFIGKAAEAVSKDPENSKGIIFGGSGQGEAMVANKYKNVRAVVFYGGSDSLEIIKLSREHNAANILSIGARFVKDEEALEATKLWLETPFPREERHKRRIDKISAIEKSK